MKLVLHFWAIILFITAVKYCKAPPVLPKCIVQSTTFIGPEESKTPCDEEERRKLEDLVAAPSATAEEFQDIQMFGAENVADLILARTNAIFDYQRHNLQNLFICPKHLNEFGKEWKRSERTVTIQGRRESKCNVPDLDGFQSQHTQAVKGRRSMTKEESQTVWRYYHKLVPLGTGMCKRHQAFVRSLPTGEITPIATAEAGTETEVDTATNGADGSAQGRNVGGHNLRHRHQHQLYESPQQRSTFRGLPRVPNSDGSQSSAVSSFHPSSPDSQDQGPHSSITRNREQIRESIRSIASALGISRDRVNFPSSFENLEARTKANKIGIAARVTDAVAIAFAPDAPNQLKEALLQRETGQTWNRKHSEKFIGVVDDAVEHYLNASSRQQRLETLAIIAPWFKRAELQKFIPGLTRYAWKEARRYAKMWKAGMIKYEAQAPRERYDKKKVLQFIEFITSPQIASDLPFGKLTVKRSTGAKQEIPNLLRTATNIRIVQQYKKLMEFRGASNMVMSDSTMLRILDTCRATTRKSMKGIDYLTYEGTEGITNLLQLVKTIKSIDGDAEWEKSTSRILKEVKMFFKTDYKVYIEEHSEFADYCRSYALSDSTDGALKVQQHNNDHKRRCAICTALMDTFRSIETKIASITWPSAAEKTEAEFTMEQSQRGVLDWQKHVIRTIHQEKAKEELMLNMDDNTVHLTLDWAMKFIPEKGRESQTEWYGKRGLSWHIIVAFGKRQNVYHQRTYVHVFDHSKQDGESIVAILLDTMKRIKAELPAVTKAYVRSDNAVCYHGAITLTSVPKISAESGITIQRWDFSETQSGKGPADRASNVIKRHVKMFVAEGNAATTAAEFVRAASSHDGVKSATFIHANLQAVTGSRSRPSIPDISKLNNYEYTGAQMRAWRAYKIGQGKVIRYTAPTGMPKLEPIYAQFTHGQSHESLGAPGTPWIGLRSDHIPDTQRNSPTDTENRWSSSFIPDEDDDGTEEACAAEASSSDTRRQCDDDPREFEGPNRQRLFPCEEEACTKVFQSYKNWWKHVNIGKHTRRVERQLLRDFSIDTYVRQIEQNQLFSNAPSVLSALRSQQTAEDPEDDPTYRLPVGWALKDRKEVKRFTESQKQFLQEKFDEGIRDSKKYDARDVAKIMRKDPRFPNKGDWLTGAQIQSFWSRLAQNRERTMAAETTTNDDSNFSGDDHIGDDDVAHRMFEVNVMETVHTSEAQIFDDTMSATAYQQHIDEVVESVWRRVCENTAHPSAACE